MNRRNALKAIMTTVAATALPAKAMAQQPLTRTEEGAILDCGDFNVLFHANYGGTPLRWTKKDGQELVADHPGESASCYFNNGQDATQAGPNGIDVFPIARFDKPDTWVHTYYAHEVAFDSAGLYEVRGFMPYFWLSHEIGDDCHPTIGTKSPWATLYNNFTGLPAQNFTFIGAPIYFWPYPGTANSGIIMVGDEITNIFDNKEWNQSILRIPDGRFAFKCRISLKNASGDAIAGMLLRKNIPSIGTINIDDCFNAPGLHLNINSGGVIQILKNGQVIFQHHLNNDLFVKLFSSWGMTIEVRTENFAPDALQIYAEGQHLGTCHNADVIGGECFGLFGSCSSGHIMFANRQLFDVGTEFRVRAESTDQKTLRLSETINRVASPLVASFYRLNLPNVFTHNSLRETYGIISSAGSYVSDAELMRAYPTSENVYSFNIDGGLCNADMVGQAKAFWSGKRDGSTGLCCAVRSATIDGQSVQSEVQVSRRNIAINPLEFFRHFEPREFSTATVVTEWASSLRKDW